MAVLEHDTCTCGKKERKENRTRLRNKICLKGTGQYGKMTDNKTKQDKNK